MKRFFSLHAIIAISVLIVGWFWIPSANANSNSESQTNIEDVKKWVVNRMISWSRPGISLHPPAIETFEDGKVRYERIAESLLKVVSRERSIFGGSHGKLRTAAIVLSISMFESSFRKDVDLNLGNEGRGDNGRSWCLMQVQLGSPIYVDGSGKRVNPIQLCKFELVGNVKMRKCEFIPPIGSRESTPSRIVFLENGGYEITPDQNRGHSGQDLIANREICFTAGLRILKSSFTRCKESPLLERLSAYASGSCEDGKEASRKRVGAAVHWLESSPPPVTDIQLVNLFSEPSLNSQNLVLNL